MNDNRIIERARKTDVRDLVEQLQLDHASGKKYACPVCPSSDALHVREDVAVCYSARHPGGTAGVLDSIELVEQARGVGFREAVEWITGRALDDDEKPQPDIPKSSGHESSDTSSDEPLDEREMLAARGVAERAAVLEHRDGMDRERAEREATSRELPATLTEDHYELIDERVAEINAAAPWDTPPPEANERSVELNKSSRQVEALGPVDDVADTFRRLDGRDEDDTDSDSTTAFLERVVRHDDTNLSDRGAAYLRGRGISREVAEAVGIVDFSHQEWGAWCAKVPDDAWLEASGLIAGSDDDPSLHPYYQHFLAIPYWSSDAFAFDDGSWHETAELETVRFRTTSEHESPKMMSVCGDGPTGSSAPYLEGSVGAAGRYSLPLIVVEGELDALSVVECARWPAVATNSASLWPAEWCNRWKSERLTDVVVVAEGDEAGVNFADLVYQRAEEANGEGWTDKHLHRVRLDKGRDLNDLLIADELQDKIRTMLDALTRARSGVHPMERHPSGPTLSEWGSARSPNCNAMDGN